MRLVFRSLKFRLKYLLILIISIYVINYTLQINSESDFALKHEKKEIKLNDKFYEIFLIHSDHPDLSNAELILPSLARFFRDRYNYNATNSIIIDAGANVGETSAILVQLFTPINCIRQYLLHSAFNASVAYSHIESNCPKCTIKIIAIEAQHANVIVIEKRATKELWNEVKYQVVHSAVSKSASPGETVTFYGFPKAGNQQGSLAPRAAGIGSVPETVKVTTIDNLLFEHGQSRIRQSRQTSVDNIVVDNKVYLLKIDIEGFDGWALEGTKQHLLHQRIKWILFEYNPKWKASSRTLRQITSWLDEQFQYVCFLIIPSAGLIPLYGKFWHPGYESWKWSNIFCGHKHDNDLVTLFQFLIEDVTSSAVMNSWMASKGF